jgi:hypothetical protein
MSKLLANQIANYNDNGPVEAKEGLNLPTGKPLEVNGASGNVGQFLRSTGNGVSWDDVSIPAAQVNADWSSSSGVTQILNKPTISAVGQSGDYGDLINKPIIPPSQVQSDWNETSGLGVVLNKPSLFSGLYSDLIGKPQIPSTITDLSDVNLPSPILDGTYIKWNVAQARWIASSGSAGITEIKEDSTPQLGGNLDIQGYGIGGQGVIDISSQSNRIRFHFDTTADLPSPSTYHGMFAHVHATGGAYFAHSGNWVELAKLSDIPVDIDTTYSQSAASIATGATLRLTASNGTIDDINVNAGTGITIDQVTSSGFRINSVGGGSGGGATVTTSDDAPTSPVDGDLWWKSNEGRLKVYYADGSSNQWIDASPPLAPTNISNQSSSIAIGAHNTGPFGNSPDSIIINPNTGSIIKTGTGIEINGHILPSANAQYDLGNAEYKIRHLFLSDNSMWLGDESKVTTSSGKTQIRKRKKRDGFVPSLIVSQLISAGLISTNSQAPAHALNWFNANVYEPDKADLSLVTLSLWYQYAIAIGIDTSEVTTAGELFPSPGDSNFEESDYEESVELGQSGFTQSPITDGASTIAVDLRSPAYVLKAPSGDFQIQVGESKFEDGYTNEFTVYVDQGSTPYTISSILIKDFAGSSISTTQLRIVGTTVGSTLQAFNVKMVYLSGWKAIVEIV